MKNKYKYLVSTETQIWSNPNDADATVIASHDEENEVADSDLFEARIKALGKAESIIRFFEDEEQQDIYPNKKWSDFNNDSEYKDCKFWRFYQIKVFLIGENDERFCIYDDGDGMWLDEEEILMNLIDEYKIFKKLKIDIRQYEKLVRYVDCKTKKKLKAKILPNGMDLNNVETNVLSEFNFEEALASKRSDKKIIQKSIQSRARKIEFKTSQKHKFKAKFDDIEFSIKSTSETIPSEIQKELTKIITKWQNLK
ncbi:MAG: hypothetical protein HY840_15460 [Bacteroidetes bacterium]|nr:hypothetical protein [Bacteroidota bacterium]